MANPFDAFDEKVAVADQPQANPFDQFDKFNAYPDLEPQGSLGSFWTGIKSKAIPGIVSAVGAGAGGAFGAGAGPVGAVAAGLAGAEAGGAAGEKLQQSIFGKEAMEKEAAQIELNKLFGHELAAGAGEMLPAFASPAGFEKGVAKGAVAGAEQVAKKTLGEKALQGVEHAAKAGLIMGGAAEGERQAKEGKLDAMGLVTHPLEEAVKFAPVGLVPGFSVAPKIFGPVAGQILGGIGKAVPDAAVMTLTGNLYDHFVHDKPLSFANVTDETGQSIPSFMLLNGLMGLLHAPGMMGKINEARQQAGKPPLSVDEYTAANADNFEASKVTQADLAGQQKMAEVQTAADAAREASSPATAEVLEGKAVDAASEAANQVLEQPNPNVEEAKSAAESPEVPPVDAKEAEAEVPSVAGAVEAPSGTGTEGAGVAPIRTETPPAAPEAKAAPEPPKEEPTQPEQPKSPREEAKWWEDALRNAKTPQERRQVMEYANRQRSSIVPAEGKAASEFADRYNINGHPKSASEQTLEYLDRFDRKKTDEGRQNAVDAIAGFAKLGDEHAVAALDHIKSVSGMEPSKPKEIEKPQSTEEVKPPIKREQIEVKPKATESNALPKQQPAEVLPREQGKAPEAGGERGGVGQGKQGDEAPGAQAPPPAEAEAPVKKPWTEAKLPKHLSGAKPRYGYGQKQFELKFESDLDKAAYIAAQKNPSKRDADFVSWAKEESGLSEDGIRQHGQKVREAIKRMAKDSTEKSIDVPSQEPRNQEPKEETPKQVEPEIGLSKKRFDQKYVNDVRRIGMERIKRDPSVKERYEEKLGVKLTEDQALDLAIEWMQQSKERGEMPLINDAMGDQPEWSVKKAWDAISSAEPRYMVSDEGEAKDSYDSILERGDSGESLHDVLRSAKPQERQRAVDEWLQRNPKSAERLRQEIENKIGDEYDLFKSVKKELGASDSGEYLRISDTKPLTVSRFDSHGDDLSIYGEDDIRNPESSGKGNESPLSPVEASILSKLLPEYSRPITINDRGDVIPLSERFKPESDDIRYKVTSEIPDDTMASKKGMRDVAEATGVEPAEDEKVKTPKEYRASVVRESEDTLRKKVLEELYRDHSKATVQDEYRVARLAEQIGLRIADIDRRAGNRQLTMSERGGLAKERAAAEEDLRKVLIVNSRLGTAWHERGMARQQILANEFKSDNMLKRLREAAGRRENTEADKATAKRLEQLYKKHMETVAEATDKNRGVLLDAARDKAKAVARMQAERMSGKKVNNDDWAEQGHNSITQVKQMLEGSNFDTRRIKVVYDTEPKLLPTKDGKTAKVRVAGWVEGDKVFINAREIRDSDHLIDVYSHEFGHLASTLPEVRKELSRVIKAVRENKKLNAELQKHLEKYKDKQTGKYDPKIMESEEAAEALRILSKARGEKTSLQKAIKSIAKSFGLEKDIDFAERIAAQAITDIAFKYKSNSYIDAKDSVKQFAVEGEAESQSTEKADGKSIEEYNQKLEEKLHKEQDPDAAIEQAIVRASTMDGDFVENVHNLIKDNPNFTDLTKGDIGDRMIDWMQEKFATDGSLKRERSRLKNQESKTPKGSPEAEKIKKRIAALQKRLDEGNFIKEPKEYTHLKEDEWSLKLKEDDLRRELFKAIQDRRRENRPFAQRVGDSASDAINFARSIMTGADLSAVLRQGIFPTLANPVRSLKAMPAMLKAFASSEFQREEMNRIRHRPNAPLYEEGNLFLKDPDETTPSAMEEAFMSRWIAKWPRALGGGVVRGSERAYVTFLNRLRADVFDSLASAMKKPHEEFTHEEIEALGNAANVLTGRGKIFGKKGAATGLNLLFFSPNYVASTFNTMFGQPFYHGSGATRKAIAGEYARFLGGAALIYTLASQLLGDEAEIETDPRSSDFGKIKLGNTRVNPIGGLIQNTTLLSRIATGETKTASGQIQPLRGDGVKYGGQTTTDVIGRYMRQKLSPIVSAGLNVAAGQDVVGQPTDLASEAGKLVYPLSMRDIQEVMEDQGVPRGTALSILSLFGMGVNAYDSNRPR